MVSLQIFIYNNKNVQLSYLKTKDIRLTATTRISRRLNPLRQKLPGWKMNPYAIILNRHSMVKIVVKK